MEIPTHPEELEKIDNIIRGTKTLSNHLTHEIIKSLEIEFKTLTDKIIEHDNEIKNIVLLLKKICVIEDNDKEEIENIEEKNE